MVLTVSGRLSDVSENLDRAILLALAEGPRGVVCDLSAVIRDADYATVEVLASAGRHVRDWSGIPVAVACPDPRVREALVAHQIGGRLIVTATVFSAVSMVLLTPSVVVETLRLAPHPTAPRASRDFVTRNLLDWGLGRLILAANLVVTELVTKSTMHATTDIEVSIACNLRALRLTVRDNGPAVPTVVPAYLDLNRSKRSAVTGLSRAFGVLPTTGGGKVSWAVLDAAQPRPLKSGRRPRRATASQESPQVTATPGQAELSVCAV